MPKARPRQPAKRSGKPANSKRIRPAVAARSAGTTTGPWSVPTGGSAEADALLAALPEPRRSELTRIDRFIRQTLPALTRHAWSGMIGYGPLHYRYPSGREGDTFKISLASRAAYVSIYICAVDERGHVAERYRARLPEADVGKGCVRFKRFDDLDPAAVRDLLRETDRVGYAV